MDQQQAPRQQQHVIGGSAEGVPAGSQDQLQRSGSAAGGGGGSAGAQQQHQHQQQQQQPAVDTPAITTGDSTAGQGTSSAAAPAEGGQPGEVQITLGSVNKSIKARIGSLHNHAERCAAGITSSCESLQGHDKVIADTQAAVLTLTVPPMRPGKGRMPYFISAFGLDGLEPDDWTTLEELLKHAGRFVLSCMARRQAKKAMQAAIAEATTRCEEARQQVRQQQATGGVRGGGASSSRADAGGNRSTPSAAPCQDPLSVGALAAAAPSKARTTILRELFKVLRRYGKLPSSASSYCSLGARPAGGAWSLWVVPGAAARPLRPLGNSSSSLPLPLPSTGGSQGVAAAAAGAASGPLQGTPADGAPTDTAQATSSGMQEGTAAAAATTAAGAAAESGATGSRVCGCGNSCAAGRRELTWPDKVPFVDLMAYTVVEEVQLQLLEAWAPSLSADFCGGEVLQLVELYEQAMFERGLKASTEPGSSSGAAVRGAATAAAEAAGAAGAATELQAAGGAAPSTTALVPESAAAGGVPGPSAAGAASAAAGPAAEHGRVTATEPTPTAAAVVGPATTGTGPAPSATTARGIDVSTPSSAAGTSGDNDAAGTSLRAHAEVPVMHQSAAAAQTAAAAAAGGVSGGQGRASGSASRSMQPGSVPASTGASSSTASATGRKRGRKRLQQSQQLLPPLFVQQDAGAVAGGVGEGDAPSPRQAGKRVRWADHQQQSAATQQQQQQELLQGQSCATCYDAKGNQLICDYCKRCWHLQCLAPPLEAVPEEEVWLCADCNTPEHSAATLEALRYHGRWVQSTFWGIKGSFWGQLSYSNMGTLAIKYSDGDGFDSVTVQQVEGAVKLRKHRTIQLQPQGVVVPGDVLRAFKACDWLVEEEDSG